MAATTSPGPAHLRLVPALALSATPPDQAAASADLLVCIKTAYARYKGSRADLEAERIIPEETEWPDSGAQTVRWEDGKLEFTLGRTRPDGMKGPMKLWLEGDYWCLVISVKDPDNRWHNQAEIRAKARALADEIHRQSPAGRREWSNGWTQYWKARDDKAFQAFKALVVPEPKKLGRPAKVRTLDRMQGAQGQGASA